MRRTTIALVLACAPGYLAAQGQGSTESRPAGQAAASQSQAQASSGFSAEARLRLETMFRAAREKDLPTEPMTDRMAEGQAKGASEAQIVSATGRVQAELAASQEALIRAGRAQPSDAEVVSGAQLIARGATSAQLEAFVRRAPAERRLEVAFAVLTELAARGVSVERAIAVVGVQLGSAASDRSLIALTGSTASQLNGSAGAQSGATGTGATGGSVAVQTGGSAGTSAGGASLGASATAGAAGKLGVGLPRRP